MSVAAGRITRCRAAGLLLLLASALTASPAPAQNSPEARLKKVEAEIRALQRKVYPNGQSRYFEAEIQPNSAGPSAPPATTGAVTDLLARVDAVEAQLQRLTAQIEESGNLAARLETRVAALEGGGAAPVRTGGTLPGRTLPDGGLPTGAPLTAIPAGAALGDPAARLTAISTIPRPQSDDPGEDAYLYGYRLWQAKFLPEAAQQLQSTLQQYPRHKRASYTRNLLGRVYLEDGKPGTAAQMFLQNYQADRNGARASDSLLFLAIAMTRLKEAPRACVALQELSEGYPAEVAGRLAADYQAARAAVQCN